MKKILITGSTGLIGSAVLTELNKNKNNCIITTNRNSNSNTNHQCITLNLNEQTIDLPNDIHTVLHIAGEKSNQSSMWKVNYEGTKNLLLAAKKNDVKKFIYLSSVGVYGASKHAGEINANSNKNPQNLYEKSKNAAEDFVRTYCEKNNMQYTVAQPSNVIGYIDGQTYPLLGLIKIINKGIFTYFGNDQSISNYIDHKNVASALVHICENDTSKKTFILNTPCKLKKIVQWISEELNITPTNRQLPMFIGELSGYAGDIIQQITKKSFYFDSAKFRELSNTTLFDDEKIFETLNFKYPLPIETTIRQLVRTYIQKKLI